MKKNVRQFMLGDGVKAFNDDAFDFVAWAEEERLNLCC